MPNLVACLYGIDVERALDIDGRADRSLPRNIGKLVLHPIINPLRHIDGVADAGHNGRSLANPLHGPVIRRNEARAQVNDLAR